MLISLLLGFVILLILGGAIFIAKAGIFFCEDGRMLKILLGGYFSLYLLAALLIKVAVPPIRGTGVDMRSVTGTWSQVAAGLDFTSSLPWIVKTAFGAKQ